MSPYLFTASELAKIFGRADRTIYNWLKAGNIPHDGDKYDLVELLAYYEKEYFKGDSANLKNEQMRLKIEKDRLELEIMRGKYIKYDDVITEWASRASETKTLLLSLPIKIASEFDAKQRTKIQGVVKKYVYELLQSYVRPTQYTPEINDKEEDNGTKQEGKTTNKTRRSATKPKPKTNR